MNTTEKLVESLLGEAEDVRLDKKLLDDLYGHLMAIESMASSVAHTAKSYQGNVKQGSFPPHVDPKRLLAIIVEVTKELGDVQYKLGKAH